MTYRDLVRNRLRVLVEEYLDEMEEHEDYPDQTSVEERVNDFVTYLYNKEMEGT
jgi:hypothetical protein